MLEIVFLIWYVKKLAGIAATKHRSSGWGALGAIGWVGGEVSGGIVGARGGAVGMDLYGYALLGAAVGAVVAYLVVRLLPALPPPGFPTARVV